MNDRTSTRGRRSLSGDEAQWFTTWRTDVRESVLKAVSQFLDEHCAEVLSGSRVDVVEDVVRDLLADGKCLRSTFMYLGWTCGAPASDEAMRAAASLELLHAFALMQDDVMDGSPTRRGRPAAHECFRQWHQQRGLPGSAARFGESAAVLLSDLCLVWAAQMLRESGLESDALDRCWPRYDAMRTELAVGQFADLVNDTAAFPAMSESLDVARRKSGNYTVCRPLELGAALAGCEEPTMTALAGYGMAIGEAFQLRDDLLGVFGVPATTGKPAGSDLAARKATTVVVAAHELADGAQRRELRQLMTADDLDDADVARWQELIGATGAVERIEQLIERRVGEALDFVDAVTLDRDPRLALTAMATASTERAA